MFPDAHVILGDVVVTQIFEYKKYDINQMKQKIHRGHRVKSIRVFGPSIFLLDKKYL